MLAKDTNCRYSHAVAILAENHARQMFLYYFLRAQLEAAGVIPAAELTLVHAAAVEARRFGFRLEAAAEKSGLRLDEYDEDRLRREAYRAAEVSLTNEVAAREIENRVVSETAEFALNAAPAEVAEEGLRRAA